MPTDPTSIHATFGSPSYPPGGGGQEIFQALQKHGIVITRLPIVVFLLPFLARVALRPRLPNPGGCGVELSTMPLIARKPKRDLQTAVDETLRRTIHHRPVELRLFR